MSDFQSKLKRVRVLIGLFTLLNAAHSAIAEERISFRVYKPYSGFSMSFGQTHLVGYYEPNAGECKATLFMMKKGSMDEVDLTPPVRFTQSIRPGDMSVINTPEKSVILRCFSKAEGLTVRTTDRTPDMIVGNTPKEIR